MIVLNKISQQFELTKLFPMKAFNKKTARPQLWAIGDIRSRIDRSERHAPVNIDDLSSFSIDVYFSDPASTGDEPYTCEFDLDGDSTIDATVSDVTGTSCETTRSSRRPGPAPRYSGS